MRCIIYVFFLATYAIEPIFGNSKVRTVKIDFELYDFENATLCCAFCQNHRGKKCRVTVSDRFDSYAQNCQVDVKLPRYRDKNAMARAYRVVPNDPIDIAHHIENDVEDKKEKVRLMWLEQVKSGGFRLAENVLTFATCAIYGRTAKSSDLKYVADALLDLYGVPGDNFHDISFDAYEACGSLCKVTLVRTPIDVQRYLDLEEAAWYG